MTYYDDASYLVSDPDMAGRTMLTLFLALIAVGIVMMLIDMNAHKEDAR